MIAHKKILVISHNALSLHSNNGKTLNSLFQDWPVNNLAQLFFSKEIPENLRFNKFFRVTDLDVLKSILCFWLRHVCGTILSPVVPIFENNSDGMEIIPKFNFKLIKLINKFNSLKLILRNSIFGTNFWESKKLLNWVTSFRPDLIFFVGGDSLFSFRIAKRLSDIFGIPLYIYITDDYVINLTEKSFIKKYLNRQLLDAYRNCFLIAREVFVIGDDMAYEFEKLFNRKFIPIMNSVDVIHQVALDTRDLMSNNEPVDIVYAGGLHLGRDRALCDFGCILNKFSKELNVRINFNVYSMSPPDNVIMQKFKKEGIHFNGGLGGASLNERLGAADLLLHVESFDFNYRNKTKLSVSTKIPEYLATGVCLIAYGPVEVASIRLIDNYGIGLSITDDDDEVKKIEKLKEIFLNAISRRDLAFKGLIFARSRFDGEKTRAMLFNTLK